MELLTEGPSETKKILEKPFFASISVPLGILIAGALIIWGVTKMISVERDYRDLIRDLESKTFGNRWVSAYELSKLLATSQIPRDEQAWVIQRLSSLYADDRDPKARRFLITALGSLQHPMTIPILETALSDQDSAIQFQAVVSLASMPRDFSIAWAKVIKLLDSKDTGIQHASILALAQHRVAVAEEHLLKFLNSNEASLRYAAATGLMVFKNEKALTVLREILNLEENVEARGFTPDKVKNLKMNVLSTAMREKWAALNPEFEKISKVEQNIKIRGKALEALKILKN